MMYSIHRHTLAGLRRPGGEPASATSQLSFYDGMVRPERRVVLAGASPVRVSAGAPGSRLQPGGEIRPSQAECRKPLKQRGANQRAATTSERCSHVILSAERGSRGPSRSCRGEGNRQHPGPERVLDLSGVSGGGTLGRRKKGKEESTTPPPARAERTARERGGRQ